MLSIKHVSKSRIILCSIVALNNQLLASTSSLCHCCYATSSSSSSSANPSLLPPSFLYGINASEIVGTFKGWFKTRNNALLDRIYEILEIKGDKVGDELAAMRSTDDALSQLGLRLNESFVLEVLDYGNDVLSCLKFFDWAGRQPGFYHTRVTFNAIFKILSRAKLKPLILDFLETYKMQSFAHKVRFNDILVIGYSVTGKPEIALQVFGRMRFKGMDLDAFAYHVLLNALVEESCFDAVMVIWKQIQKRGFQNEITIAIMMKSYCKQNKLGEAEAFLNGLLSVKQVLSGREVSILVRALCKTKKFERAGKLIHDIQNSGSVPLEAAYGVWIGELVQAGRLDEALDFFRQKESLHGYAPNLFEYNTLISRFLRENRLVEVYDLLIEMKVKHIAPDMFTMNAVLCFFCKAGMVDVALELYGSRYEFGLSPNDIVYKNLIRTLVWNRNTNAAYLLLLNYIDQGYLLSHRIFSTVANALCGEGKVDQMKKLVSLALERNFMPSAFACNKFISALSRAGRIEDGYLLHGELNNVSSRHTYSSLIKGFNKSNRADIAARLLIEMQVKGHIPTRPLFKGVIHHVLNTNNPKYQFLNLLVMHLSLHELNCWIYNYFIEGAGYAKKPDLAREVYEMMLRNGIKPNLSSNKLMLNSFLKSGRISDALNFFNDLQFQGVAGKKLYNTLIVGLCKANRIDTALEFFSEMRKIKVTPTTECYELLVQELCRVKRYSEAISLVNDYEKMGRRLTSFIGNILLLHSLRGPELYDACVRVRGVGEEASSDSSILSLLIGAFSGSFSVHEDTGNLEEFIERCFPLDLYTYNLLLRKASMTNIGQACELFNHMCRKGYEPDRWSYDIMVHGFSKHGMKVEAKLWVEDMFRKGFYPTMLTSTFP